MYMYITVYTYFTCTSIIKPLKQVRCAIPLCMLAAVLVVRRKRSVRTEYRLVIAVRINRNICATLVLS